MAKENLGALQMAVRWAAKLHRGQNRDGPAPLPYLTHPIDVMNLLRYTARIEDEQILCAAALHDVVEECGVALSEIETRFGPRVAKLVQELTRQEPTADQIADLSQEQITSLRGKMLLEDIARMGPEAMLVKLADRHSNLRSALATRTGKKLDRYARQSQEILKIIPKETSPDLWEGIERMAAKAVGSDA